MKAANIINLAIGLFITPFLASVLLFAPQQARAQDSGYPAPEDKYSREELAQMLAPIALYPDVLLSQVLMASTYPIEVIEADRWVRRNPGLQDGALDDVLLAEDWDPSVKALCHFPSILALMSERITETTSLGNAFLAQEAEVMDMVQELRSKAFAQGNLSSNAQQRIVVEKETIIIEPAAPRVIYVPYYDPFYVYGPWWYPAYPPWYWGPPGVAIGFGISYWPAFYFSFTFGSWSYFDWHRHTIFIDVHKRPRFVRHDRWIKLPGRWHHAPLHRRGVAYRDKSTARKYGQYPHRSSDFRRDIRGFPERINPDRKRDRRSDVRTGIDRNRRGDDRLRRDGGRQLQPRGERKPQMGAQGDRDRRMRQTIDRDRQLRERAERDRQERAKLERGRQKGQRVESGRQVQQRTDKAQRSGKRVERLQRQESRDNIFNRLENGRRERQASERGRTSRQSRGGDSRGRGRSGGDTKGGHYDWGRHVR